MRCIKVSCLFEGAPIVLHLRSVPILPGWRGYVQSCYARVDEWTNKFQLDFEVRNGIYIIKTASFFLSVYHIYHNLKMMESFYVFTVAA
jgi:hypothetical protein